MKKESFFHTNDTLKLKPKPMPFKRNPFKSFKSLIQYSNFKFQGSGIKKSF